MTCSNGYFTSPSSNSLAEALTLAPDRGAIAAFSPTGLSLDSAAHLYHRALIQELQSSAHSRSSPHRTNTPRQAPSQNSSPSTTSSQTPHSGSGRWRTCDHVLSSPQEGLVPQPKRDEGVT